jgi:hypothetical protein
VRQLQIREAEAGQKDATLQALHRHREAAEAQGEDDMTPFDRANVEAFMAEVGGSAMYLVTALAVGPGALVPAAVLNLATRLQKLTPWEQVEVVYRLHDSVRALLKEQTQRFNANARAADDEKK